MLKHVIQIVIICIFMLLLGYGILVFAFLANEGWSNYEHELKLPRMQSDFISFFIDGAMENDDDVDLLMVKLCNRENGFFCSELTKLPLDSDIIILQSEINKCRFIDYDLFVILVCDGKKVKGYVAVGRNITYESGFMVKDTSGLDAVQEDLLDEEIKQLPFFKLTVNGKIDYRVSQ